ncbi:hypothetical protein [Dichelobacter nodosus]|uniref:hypothetical protein n=1 Tax=Dichelobacter nodosus TaxID=870 RepID=UPI00128E40E3|nr:hypothetical protein [Dichelobacter nodosus]
MRLDLHPISNGSRMYSHVLIRLSEVDRKNLEKLAKKSKYPISTIAYCALRAVLDAEFNHRSDQ